jgi:hypothetical protein
MAQGRHQRPALVNTVMNRPVTIGAFTATKIIKYFWVRKVWEIFRTTWRPLAFQEGVFNMELVLLVPEFFHLHLHIQVKNETLFHILWPPTLFGRNSTSCCFGTRPACSNVASSVDVFPQPSFDSCHGNQIKCVPGAFSLVVKRPEGKGNHLSPVQKFRMPEALLPLPYTSSRRDV